MKSKILKALFSAALAIGIWFYVVTVISPNSDKQFYNIQVDTSSKVLLHEQNLMIVDMDTTEVSIHLEGNRIDLNKLNSKKIPVTLDVSKIYGPGTHQVPYDVDIPGTVNIRSKSPSAITVEVVSRSSDDIPVEVDYGETVVAGGYMRDPKEILSTNYIKIAGPAEDVVQITKAKIKVDLTGRKENISEEFAYTLCDENDEPVDARFITVDVERVRLDLAIMRLKEVKLDVDFLPGGGATKDNITYKVLPEMISLSGSEELLNDLEILTVGSVNLAEILEDQTVTLPINLKEGLFSEDGVTEVEVEITLPELITRTVTVTNIEARKPDSMNVEFLRKSMEIQIRGPKDKVEAVNPDDVKIIVDFSDTKADSTEKAAVKKNAQIEGLDEAVGALGTYTVSAYVSKAEG